MPEIIIETADRHEELRRVQAHHLVADLAEPGERLGGADRHREDDAAGTLAARDLAGGMRSGSCRQPVVDHDRDLAGQVDVRAAGPELHRLAVEVGTLACFHGGDLLAGDAAAPDDLLVAHLDAALADRAHRELGLEGDSQLAHHDHVERGVQRPGDLEGDWHPAARQTEDDSVSAAQVFE